MDPVLLIGPVASLVGVAVGAWLNDHFASRREARAAEERRKDEALTRKCQQILEALDQTRRQINAQLMQQLAQWTGDLEGARMIRYSRDVYPRADVLLLGDVAAIKAFIDTAIHFLAFKPGQRATVDDGNRVVRTLTVVERALREQEELATGDLPLKTVDWNEREDGEAYERLARLREVMEGRSQQE
jgi:hypothetical protein